MTRTAAVLLVLPLLVGCETLGPAISKSELGNLEINVAGPRDASTQYADIYIDGVFVGNITRDKPVLYIRRGEREVRVELPGHTTYERRVNVLGDPNHQILNVFLKPDGAVPLPELIP